MPKPRKSLFAEPYVQLIHRLRDRREALGITQWELANAYGEDQSFISRIERCQRRLDVFEFTVLCRLLGIDPGDFLRPVWEHLTHQPLEPSADGEEGGERPARND